MLLNDYTDWLPFSDAVALLGVAPQTFKVYIRQQKIERVKNPLAMGRWLYGKKSILELKATKRKYVKKRSTN